ncbi:MAG: DUF523 domain-containing protein [Tissierellales bacterium]|jgi:uncharacterized protein YbbK (DUF523 family)|nr:DUF523 domain-containing protein [Tissierellales bacterium]
MIAISACLAGVSCRYDGNANTCKKAQELIKEGKAIIICPEQLGGMETPRTPCEIKDGRVINENGEDKTKEFIKGADEALKICKLYGVKEAILKSGSPSCGYGRIYDGNFSRIKIDGNGITAQKFIEAGIKIKTEKDI